jgi:hypothetical protein
MTRSQNVQKKVSIDEHVDSAIGNLNRTIIGVYQSYRTPPTIWR